MSELNTPSNPPVAIAATPLAPHHCGWNGGPNSNRTGQSCRGLAMANGRCRVHGGGMASGALHPAFKHGRFSKALPARLAQKFQAALDDPELLSMRSSVAILSTRIVEIAERFDAGGSGELWAQLLVQWTNLEHANTDARKHREAGDPDKTARAASRAGEALSAIGKLVQAGHSEEATWRELVDAIKDLAGVSGVEHKRLLDLNQFMTAGQAAMFVGALQQAVVETVVEGQVVDRGMLQRLGRRTDELLSGGKRSDGMEHGAPSEFDGHASGLVDALPAPTAGSQLWSPALPHPELVGEPSPFDPFPPA
jgi:hypothetical protein